MTITYKGDTFKSGDKVMMSVKGSQIFAATIHVTSKSTFYMCSDNSKFSGETSPNKHGHHYSWVFKLDPNNEIKNSEERNTTIIKHLNGKLENLKIKTSTKLKILFKKYPDYNFLFSIKLGVIDDYKEIKDSKDGYVELIGNKNVRIKLGRLIKKLADSYNKVYNKDFPKFEIKDSAIEALHNHWVSLNAAITFTFLKGQDFLKGYTKDNYTKQATIKSCMTDKLSRLKIYTENPKQINLCTFNLNGEIVGRCVIWICNRKKYYDRIYFAYDWLVPLVEEHFDKKKILSAKKHKLKIKLENSKFDTYPYMDTMMYLNMDTKTLYNDGNSDYNKYLR
jgi:hypothetical protein